MRRGSSPGPERVAFPLRIEPQILDAVKCIAEGEIRRTNAQIVILAREALLERGAIRMEAP